MENLSETLKQQAISLGLCQQWQRQWGDCNQQELIDKYKKGIDFCLEHQYPSNDFIKENFDRTLLHKNLIFVDEHLNLDNAPNGIYVLNGDCSGVLHFREWTAATVYVRHTSNISIIAEDFAKVFVRVYDEAEVNVCDVGDGVVKMYDKRI
ncbi:MAG: hypothetical protein HDS16_05180 [Bacteroides sp.]|nr:hypothetical protein [Bacteroides sp.]